MGKATGFMEFNRKNCSERGCALNRGIIGMNLIHLLQKRKEENKGQDVWTVEPIVKIKYKGKANNMATGCPLHNLIPE